MISQILISGILLVLTPFLGVPDSWKFFIYIIVGLGLIARVVVEKKIFFSVFLKPKDNQSSSEVEKSPEN